MLFSGALCLRISATETQLSIFLTTRLAARGLPSSDALSTPMPLPEHAHAHAHPGFQNLLGVPAFPKSNQIHRYVLSFRFSKASVVRILLAEDTTLLVLIHCCAFGNEVIAIACFQKPQSYDCNGQNRLHLLGDLEPC